ncbi:hypothetical protein [Neobacillus bataviensis]|uniref:hypothetical protein n=1 Tax=Neobacillus bataviensis TaxID=220685 RepID=UPI0034DAC062
MLRCFVTLKGKKILKENERDNYFWGIICAAAARLGNSSSRGDNSHVQCMTETKS